MSDKRPVGIVLHEKADRMYVICADGTAYSAKVGHPGIVMGWHEIDPIPGTPAFDLTTGAGVAEVGSAI